MAARISAAGSLYVDATGRPASNGSWTIAGWVNRVVQTNDWAGVLLIESGTGNVFEITFKETGTNLRISNANGFIDTIDPGTGVPFFLCASCAGTGTGQVTVYVRRMADAAFTTVSHQVAGGASTSFIYGGPSWGGRLNGTLESMMCWDVPLTAAEVEAQWLSRRPVKPESLRHWFPSIDDTLAGAIKDYSGRGSVITVNGTVTVQDNSVPIGWGGTSLLAPATPPLVEILGTSATTLSNAVMSAAGQLAIAAASNPTLSNAVMSAAGQLAIAAASNPTLANAVLAAEGVIGDIIAGVTNATLADAQLTAVGTLALQAAIATALEDAVLSATGRLTLAGVSNPTLQDAVLSGVITLILPISGTVSVTLQDAVLEAILSRPRTTPFYNVGVVRPEHIAEYLATRHKPSHRLKKRMDLKELLLRSQLDDMLRRRSEGS